MTEIDEMFQNAHEKGEQHRDPKDPPRGRGINAGHGTYENDRLSVGGAQKKFFAGYITIPEFVTVEFISKFVRRTQS